MEEINRCWVLAEATTGKELSKMSLSREQFERRDIPIAELREGQVLIRSVYFSPDPMNHAWVQGVPGRFEPIPVGRPLRGGVAGRVVASRNPCYAVGDGVSGFLEWCDYNVSSGRDLLDLPLYRLPADLNLASALCALGMTGICAWLNVCQYGQPAPGDRVVVSGASGAIGTMSAQIARLYGCQVVGLARGEEKCRFISGLGFDHSVNISNEHWGDELARLCPSGVDVFIDNVGGHVLDTALVNMASGGRIVICGATAHYESGAHISNHLMLAITGCRMEGYFYFDQQHHWEKARARISQWLREGKIVETLDICQGFETVPDAALGQFQGASFGRKLVQVNGGG